MMTADDILEGLTEAQQQAVTHIDGPVLVLAGPGSGKTTVVTRRVANLIAQGIPPWQILALTFTNKAAGEMRERIDRMLPENLPGRRGLTVTTFHSFCARLLRRYAEPAGLNPNYSIYDSADQRDAIKRALKAANMDSKNWTPGSIQSAISNAKNRLLNAEGLMAESFDFHSRSQAKAYQHYEKILKKNDAVDFDDLLMLVAQMLRDEDEVRDELQSRYQYLLIDEYQDTNHAQFLIAHSLAAEHQNICVVGDPDQSIYGWRGADIRNILEFEQHYPDATVIPLGQNFRSTGNIVATAAALISNNTHRKHKDIYTEEDEGERPRIIACQNEHHEAELIAEDFLRLHIDNDVPYREMAVLYRVNALSRVLEEAFRDRSIPYVIARGTAFYDRKEIKDALSYLRLLANPNDEVALRRIINTPTRGIGKTTLDKVELFSITNGVTFIEALRRAKEISSLNARAVSAIGKFTGMFDHWQHLLEGNTLLHGAIFTLPDLVEQVIRDSGMEKLYANSRSEEDEQRLENLNELISAAAEFTPPVPDVAPESPEAPEVEPEETASSDGFEELPIADHLRAFLESVALVSDADAIDPAKGAVTLMTLHAAKGLEFHAVAMAGLEFGLLPHTRAATSDSEMEEERRLCFVGITRAKRSLMLTRAAVRTHRGMRERTMASPFLEELPDDCVVQHDFAGVDDMLDGGGVDGFGGGWGRRRRRGTTVNDPFVSDYIDNVCQDDDLPVGAVVRHPHFGLGKVEAYTPRAVGATARIRFDSVGPKTLILEHAKLTRVG